MDISETKKAGIMLDLLSLADPYNDCNRYSPKRIVHTLGRDPLWHIEDKLPANFKKVTLRPSITMISKYYREKVANYFYKHRD